MKRLLSQHSDVFLAVLVVGSVAMLVIPLPTALVDVLLALNMAVAVSLLLTSTYVSNPLRLTTLPSILLLSTLFRLALNVSTTRLILLQADAGQVIDSFGDFVVSGSYIVGAVIFLILIVIQFVVIARGSERVAEVAARFTLDALPGRQMAIDSELRSGSIDRAEAHRRGDLLQRESQLYGAMDGAMKFVKGDAIAGLIITGVNIGAGLLIGVLQNGMPLSEAAALYTLLTVGDGLVTQIPSILVATAAGIIVTRVGSDRESHLAASVTRQLTRYPKAIAITAALLLGFGLLPGLPLIPFALLAVFMGLVAYTAFRRSGDTADEDRAVCVESPDRLCVRVGPEITTTVALEILKASVAQNAAEIGRSTGLPLPKIRVDVDDGLSPKVVVIDVEGMAATAPAMLEDTSSQEATLAAISRLLRDVIDENASEILGIQDVQCWISRLQSTHPALVRAAIPTSEALAQLTEVLRQYLRSGVPIGNLPRILEVFARPGRSATSTMTLAEQARAGLRREISHRFAGDTGRLEAFLVAPEVEDVLRSSIERSEGDACLRLDPGLARDLHRAIDDALGGSRFPIVMTDTEVRPHLQRLTRMASPTAVVLSYEDLLPHIEVAPLGRISVGR